MQVHIAIRFSFFSIKYFIFSHSLLPFFTGIWARRIWAIWAKPFRHCLIKCKNTFTITTWDEWVKEIAIQVRQVRKEFCMYKILFYLCLGSVSVRSAVIHLQPNLYNLAFMRDWKLKHKISIRLEIYDLKCGKMKRFFFFFLWFYPWANLLVYRLHFELK